MTEEDEAFEQMALKQGHWQHPGGNRKRQIAHIDVHSHPPQRTEQPAQRTWVGLTEQDLDYLCNLAYTGDEEFALAVQAKLMEKNA